VVLVRGLDARVAELRDVLAAEKDPVAAREQMRAIVLLGTDEDVAFAASQRSRFPASIDGDFAEAIGRIGAPRATSLYLKHVAGSRDPAPAMRLELWGRSSMASGTASRLMAARDLRGFRDLMKASAEASLVLDNGVVIAALSSPSNEIVADAIWYLAELYAFDPSQIPASLREKASAPREGASVDEALGREILRRMLGAKFVERMEFEEWLRVPAACHRFTETRDLRRFLTLGERKALDRIDPARPIGPVGTHTSEMVREPEFMLPILLPDGLADAILRKTRCIDAWIGVIRASVDRAGRVQTLDLKGVDAMGGCARAVEAMLRLSLAKPERITSPLVTANVLTVKPRGRALCFDEDPVVDQIVPRDLLRSGTGGVSAPKVVKRVEPNFPASVRNEMKSGNVVLVVESIITRTGCVRDIRLVKQTPWPALNTAAVLALSEWKFKPGTLEGVPVDVIFNLTVNFKR
jgi:TonB family protein